MLNKILQIFAIMLLVAVVFGCSERKDPFDSLPKEAYLNCGPEERYKFDVQIGSKDEFVEFIKTHNISKDLRLDNFKISADNASEEDILLAEVDYTAVLSAVKVENIGSRKIYILEYNPYSCSGFTLKMSSDGYVSVYGCCGK